MSFRVRECGARAAQEGRADSNSCAQRAKGITCIQPRSGCVPIARGCRRRRLPRVCIGTISQPETGCVIPGAARITKDDGTTLWFCNSADETRGGRSFLAPTPGYGDEVPLGFGTILILKPNWHQVEKGAENHERRSPAMNSSWLNSLARPSSSSNSRRSASASNSSSSQAAGETLWPLGAWLLPADFRLSVFIMTCCSNRLQFLGIVKRSSFYCRFRGTIT